MSLPHPPEFFLLQQAVIGRYSLERELGRGGMGIVFLARDVALDRLVAIKLLPPELAASPERRQRFLSEARMAAGLSHPHIVPIHAVEEHHELAFFVMGFVDGESLAARLLREGRLPVEEVTRIVQEVAWALAHAHGRGVIHRDIKPDNILLERGTGRALVVDFGIGRVEGSPGDTGEHQVGTPRYMSPEHRLGDEIDGRSDIYSLGVTAHVALTGSYPELGLHAASGGGARALARPIHELRPSVPERVERIVERCLAPDRDLRFRSADELAEALRATRAADATLSPPLRAWVRDVDRAGGEIGSAGAAVALALALGVLFQDIFPLPQLYLMLAVLLFTIGAARFGELVLRARAMLAEGLGHRAAARALELEEAAVQAEERVPIARRLPARTGATALLGAAKSGVLIWLVPRELPELVHLFVVAGSVVVPAAFLRRVWEDFNPESGVLARLMRGGLGRFTFAAARVGQRGLPEPLPVSEPTMLVLGRDVEELFRSLPASAREPVADIPATVALLRAEAQRLRAGGDARRLEQATAALETLRLELLRMHAGAGQVGELTLALERAREIGREVDRVEQARLEVESEATREAERTPR